MTLTETAPRTSANARGRRTRVPRALGVLVGSIALLVLTVLVSLFAGSKATGLGDVVPVLLGGGDEYVRAVVDSRVARTVLGALVGAALAASGVIVQGITRNPLGEPGLLGVNVGAAAAVVTATAFFGFSGGDTTVWVALPGAVVAVVAVVALGRRSGSESVVPLILAGAVLSAVLGAYIQGMVLARPDVFDSYRHWVVGSLAGADFDTLRAVAPAAVLGAVLALVLSSSLDALALGDELATAQGVRVPLVRMLGIAAATLLAAAATAAAGPIAFVGLAVPHIVRAAVGTEHRWQLPVSFVLGAALLIAADIVARVIVRPNELMVGVVTAFIGAPFLLAAVRRGKVIA
ncbi:FecCD family ABC transporter permease [Paramicrobacterium sp. CJ85]|uniref:FecCD family ABC transporter permease n=1 Tax=Paramicrobacterium sp. CJ85 TaxID=3445355 RepID=UPI003F5FE1B4